jgi:Fic family protein
VKLAGTEQVVIWNGRRVKAFVPQLLRDRDLSLDAKTAGSTASAAAEVGFAAEALNSDYEALARLLLRAEGVASSYIEGILAPVADVLLAEQFEGSDVAAGWVASNLAAMTQAVHEAEEEGPLSVEALCAWHRTLMAGSPTPEEHVGKIRSQQGWIGGTSPLDAHLVTPPPAELPVLLDDLLSYVNRTSEDPISQAAVAHSQFELVHPFADGNGRIGRNLVAWILTRRMSLLVPPPVSVAIAADVGGYTAGLASFQWSDHLTWIRWFADAVANGSRAQRELVAAVERLRQDWQRRLSAAPHRSDSSVLAAVNLMPRHLVFTADLLIDELDVSRKTALATLERLSEAGILTRRGRLHRPSVGQPPLVFVAHELLGLVGSSPLR